MKPSVTFQSIGALMLKDFSVTTPVDVGEIQFFVPHKSTDHIQVFLVLKDVTTGLREVLSLKEGINDLDMPVYKLPLTYALRLNNVACDMSIVKLNVDDSTYIESTPARVILTTDHYKLNRELAIVNELSVEVKQYYEAIVLALKEVIMKGDNNQ